MRNHGLRSSGELHQQQQRLSAIRRIRAKPDHRQLEGSSAKAEQSVDVSEYIGEGSRDDSHHPNNGQHLHGEQKHSAEIRSDRDDCLERRNVLSNSVGGADEQVGGLHRHLDQTADQQGRGEWVQQDTADHQRFKSDPDPGLEVQLGEYHQRYLYQVVSPFQNVL